MKNMKFAVVYSKYMLIVAILVTTLSVFMVVVSLSTGENIRELYIPLGLGCSFIWLAYFLLKDRISSNKTNNQRNLGITTVMISLAMLMLAAQQLLLKGYSIGYYLLGLSGAIIIFAIVFGIVEFTKLHKEKK